MQQLHVVSGSQRNFWRSLGRQHLPGCNLYTYARATNSYLKMQRRRLQQTNIQENEIYFAFKKEEENEEE